MELAVNVSCKTCTITVGHDGAIGVMVVDVCSVDWEAILLKFDRDY